MTMFYYDFVFRPQTHEAYMLRYGMVGAHLEMTQRGRTRCPRAVVLREIVKDVSRSQAGGKEDK